MIGAPCARCALLLDDSWISVNGRHVHADACFAEELRELAFKIGDVEVELAPTMDPMVAYRAGKTFVATVVAVRRRAKPAERRVTR